MGIAEIMIIAIGVSMDAFAVSLCKGLSISRLKGRHVGSVALWFGGFQALMPLVGYLLGVSFADFVSDVDHWIAFILLGIIGGNMMAESFKHEEDEADADFSAPRAVADGVGEEIQDYPLYFIGIRPGVHGAVVGGKAYVYASVGAEDGGGGGYVGAKPGDIHDLP